MTGLDLAPWVAGLLALLVAAWRLVRFGEYRAERKIERGYRKTRQEIDDAILTDDPGLARKRMHDRPANVR